MSVGHLAACDGWGRGATFAFSPSEVEGRATRIVRSDWYNYYTLRFRYDPTKSKSLRADRRRGISFEEAQEIWTHPYYLDQRSEVPEQFRAIGWVSGRLYSVIFEIREDEDGEYYHLVTLWKATRAEENLYAKNA